MNLNCDDINELIRRFLWLEKEKQDVINENLLLKGELQIKQDEIIMLRGLLESLNGIGEKE